MLQYIFRRIIMLIPILLGVTLLIFTMMYITPGDPALIMLGPEATEEHINAFRAQHGLDQPFFIQYFNYVVRLVTQFDMGTSYLTRQPVAVEILARYPTTILLAVLSLIVSVIVGIPLGIISATRQYSIFDNAAMLLALIGVSMPNFWQGMIFIIFFVLHLGWFPPSGFDTPAHWVLPALTIGTSSAAIITRMTRSTMLEVIRQDYIRTAKAKGASTRRVILRHALRNALLPIVTIIGINFGTMLGGAMIVETVFAMPGLGTLTIASIRALDKPVIMAAVLLVAVVVGIINLVVDVLYVFIDPRIRYR